ncbi:Hint domain-containing protein [uncultured Tateyamaria sp.]|uniref:Hint domain-containing protein n=1 Tax=uncultured Tateyamaria sp. TaxID=455651 RepID=UPI00262ED252|nr:Hint domain-containing protein [uncultured Tateyamaria sp.]
MPTTTNVINGGLTINEIGSDPTGTPGFDTDGSGDINPLADEFIEIINVSSAPISLAGVELWEDQLVHSFTGGTLGAGETLLILDNTADLASAQAANPSATIVLASGSLAIANAGDGLALVDTASGDYVAFNYGDAVGGDQASDTSGFPGTNLIGTDNTALTPDGQSIQRDPAGDDNIVAGDATPGLVCFAEGTLISGPTGEVRVETLEIGQEILTASGHLCRVHWIGRQTVRPGSALVPAKMEPVRIRAGALGNGVPHSDLIVTAEHGMIIDGLVINAAALVNGTTVQWVPAADLPATVTYYHVETLHHDAILANGAETETFVDYVGRSAFDNYAEYVALYGCDRVIREMDRPRISAARLVPEEIKARLRTAESASDFGSPDPELRIGSSGR